VDNRELGLLLDIRENPGDDVPRLIYSDYLDEGGRELHAEFIRLQVVRGEDRAGEMWILQQCPEFARAGGLAMTNYHLEASGEVRVYYPKGFECIWSRGFIKYCQAEYEVLVEELPAVTCRHPVEDIHVLNLAPFPVRPFGISRGEGDLYEWRPDLVGSAVYGRWRLRYQQYAPPRWEEVWKLIKIKSGRSRDKLLQSLDDAVLEWAKLQSEKEST